MYRSTIYAKVGITCEITEKMTPQKCKLCCWFPVIAFSNQSFKRGDINLVFGLITTPRLHRLNMQSVEAWRNHAIISIHIQNIVLKIHLTTYDV